MSYAQIRTYGLYAQDPWGQILALEVINTLSFGLRTVNRACGMSARDSQHARTANLLPDEMPLQAKLLPAESVFYGVTRVLKVAAELAGIEPRKGRARSKVRRAWLTTRST